MNHDAPISVSSRGAKKIAATMRQGRAEVEPWMSGGHARPAKSRSETINWNNPAAALFSFSMDLAIARESRRRNQ
jgi:hypothetical protein